METKGLELLLVSAPSFTSLSLCLSLLLFLYIAVFFAAVFLSLLIVFGSPVLPSHILSKHVFFLPVCLSWSPPPLPCHPSTCGEHRTVVSLVGSLRLDQGWTLTHFDWKKPLPKCSANSSSSSINLCINTPLPTTTRLTTGQDQWTFTLLFF